MGASLGLGARALSVYPDFPKLTDFEVGEGLPAAAAATYLMGKTGLAMIIVMIFFSVTSSYAGELIATSTLVSYDIYKRYINPTATPPQVVKVAKYSVFGWAIFSSCLASIFMALQKYPWAGYSIFLGVLQHQVSFNSLGFYMERFEPGRCRRWLCRWYGSSIYCLVDYL